MLSRSRIGHLKLSLAGLLKLKRRALRRKLALFGSGHRTLFDFGPHRELSGRSVARLRVVDGGPVKARLNDPADYETVQLDASFLPVHLTGEIIGSPVRSRHDVAVAVNGVIRGTSRSVRLRGKPAEYFSFLIDPQGLAKGRNEIEVFAVSRSRGRIGLRRLYSSPPAAKPPEKPPVE